MNAITRIRVKVCGVTRPGEAKALDALGIDYLGFNFYAGSKRLVAPEAAAEMISRLKNAEPVGVFVDAPAEYIAEVAAKTGIRWAQLHGSEGWDVLAHLSLPVIKAIPHTRLFDYGGLKAQWDQQEGHPRYFLVDTGNGGDFGGSGQVFDWSLLETSPLPKPFFLAGGLGPDNLRTALAALKTARPFAVDLNSKVETAPGVKDISLVQRCLNILEGFPS